MKKHLFKITTICMGLVVLTAFFMLPGCTSNKTEEKTVADEAVKYPSDYIGLYDIEINQYIYIGEEKEELSKNYLFKPSISGNYTYYEPYDRFSVYYNDDEVIEKVECSGLDSIHFKLSADKGLFDLKSDFINEFKYVFSLEESDNNLDYVCIYVSEIDGENYVLSKEDIKSGNFNSERLYCITIGYNELKNGDGGIQKWEFKKINKEDIKA